MAFFARSSSPESVCVASVGACTSIGYNASSACAAVRAGINLFREHPFMVDRFGEKMILARVEHLPAELEMVSRLEALAVAGITEALAPLRSLRFGTAPRISAVIGLPSPRPVQGGDLTQALMDRVDALRAHLGLAELTFYPNGHSAGLLALEAGFSSIQQGKLDLCLVGGLDSYLDVDVLEWLDHTEQLHSEGNTWGFIPGEASGFCLLASPSAVRRYDLEPLLWIAACATAREPNLIRTDTVCLGEGLSKAVKQALGGLPSSEDKVHKTICDMNGERYRADELAFTICRTSRRFIDASDVLTPADCWGDVGAASGPLFVALAAAAGKKGYAPGPHTLLWTSSDTGERSAALLTAHPASQGGA